MTEQKSLTVVVEQPPSEPKTTDYPSYLLAIAAILTAVATILGVYLKSKRGKR